MDLQIGDEVGARRWPYASAHPDCWGRPWKGILLAAHDPRAWVRSVVFPTDTPDPAAVRAHVRRFPRLGRDTVPVLWDFGDEQIVYWEDRASLRLYAADVVAWEAALAAARTQNEESRRRWIAATLASALERSGVQPMPAQA